MMPATTSSPPLPRRRLPPVNQLPTRHGRHLAFRLSPQRRVTLASFFFLGCHPRACSRILSILALFRSKGPPRPRSGKPRRLSRRRGSLRPLCVSLRLSDRSPSLTFPAELAHHSSPFFPPSLSKPPFDLAHSPARCPSVQLERERQIAEEKANMGESVRSIEETAIRAKLQVLVMHASGCLRSRRPGLKDPEFPLAGFGPTI